MRKMDRCCSAIGHTFYFVALEEKFVKNTSVLYTSTKAKVTKTPIYEIIFKPTFRRQILAGTGDLHHLQCDDAGPDA